MAKGKAVKAGANLVRNIAEEVGEAVSKKPKQTPWGWRGGRKEEITGKEYTSHMRKQLSEWNDTLPENDFGIELVAQLEGSRYPSLRAAAADSSSLDRVYRGFAKLESADVPREWTGRSMDAILRSKTEVRPKEFSSLMRNLNDEQREAFLGLLPNWEGSLDELARTAVAVLS
jgi:hypothetical protein